MIEGYDASIADFPFVVSLVCSDADLTTYVRQKKLESFFTRFLPGAYDADSSEPADEESLDWANLESPRAKNRTINNNSQCGGSIVSSWYVITAAHCLNDVDDPRRHCVISAGSSLLLLGSYHAVHNWAAYNMYSNTGPDLAVVRLVNPIIMDGVTKKAIRLFGPGEESKPGAIAKVAGWGRVSFEGHISRQLQSLDLKIISKKVCADYFMTPSRLSTYQFSQYINFIRLLAQMLLPSIRVEPGEICAVSFDEKKLFQGVCKGDSGGPLVIDGKLAGVISYTNRNCTAPNVFTEVAYLRKWIDKHIRI